MTQLSFQIHPLEAVLKADALSGSGSLVDQVYEQLRRRIIDLSLPPGFALVEKEVAGVLQVSKTPVREAIIRLSQEVLVQVVPKSGSYVSQVSLSRYLEACFVRSHLETGCIRRLATLGVSLADEVRLKSILNQQERPIERNDAALFFALDEALHKCFFELAGLTGVWHMLHLAVAELDRVRHIKRMFGIRHRREVLAEHSATVRAILARDPDGAETCMLENIGAVDEEVFAISGNSQLLRTIDDLNQLVALDRRRRGQKRANAA